MPSQGVEIVTHGYNFSKHSPQSVLLTTVPFVLTERAVLEAITDLLPQNAPFDLPTLEELRTADIV